VLMEIHIRVRGYFRVSTNLECWTKIFGKPNQHVIVSFPFALFVKIYSVMTLFSFCIILLGRKELIRSQHGER
jgi:hypothetical protein